jgi:hypothetical protein
MRPTNQAHLLHPFARRPVTPNMTTRTKVECGSKLLFTEITLCSIAFLQIYLGYYLTHFASYGHLLTRQHDLRPIPALVDSFRVGEKHLAW